MSLPNSWKNYLSSLSSADERNRRLTDVRDLLRHGKSPDETVTDMVNDPDAVILYRAPDDNMKILFQHSQFTGSWLDASEHGIGGFSAKTGRAWRWEIPEHLRLRVSLNMLEFIGSFIGPWFDHLEGDLPPLSCILAQTDSTTAAGWLHKSNFDDGLPDEEIGHLELLRKYATFMMEAEVVLYPQWIQGDENDFTDSLSRDTHLSVSQLLALLSRAIPEQLPPNLRICPLPPSISSWLISFLGRQTPTTQSPKVPQRSKLSLGESTLNFVTIPTIRRPPVPGPEK